MKQKILLAGESWVAQSVSIMGFDSITTCTYTEAAGPIRTAIAAASYDLDYLPNHIAGERFPFHLRELKEYACVILSDIGSNTLLQPRATIEDSAARPNRVALLCEYVAEGGGLLMIGGYLSFSGFDGKARWGQTPLADILPVRCLPTDDRVETCQGVKPVPLPGHPVFKGIDGQWPALLGYNRTQAIEDAMVLATVQGDPFIAVKCVGKGVTAAFTSDCAPHWCPREFLEWRHYNRLWKNILEMVTGR